METYSKEFDEGTVRYCIVKVRENNCVDNVVIGTVITDMPDVEHDYSYELEEFMDGVIAIAEGVGNVAKAVLHRGYTLVIDDENLWSDMEAVIMTTFSAHNLLLAAEFGVETLSQLMCMGAELPEGYSRNLDYWLQAVEEYRKYLTTTV